MKEDPKTNYRSSFFSIKGKKNPLSGRLKSKSNEQPPAPHYPILSDDIVDEMLAELHEKENVAHE